MQIHDVDLQIRWEEIFFFETSKKFIFLWNLFCYETLSISGEFDFLLPIIHLLKNLSMSVGDAFPLSEGLYCFFFYLLRGGFETPIFIHAF